MAMGEISLDSGILLSQRNHLCCVVVGCLATATWDIVAHLRLDVRLLRKTGIHLPQILYIISRIAMFAYLLGETVFLASPIRSRCSSALYTGVASLRIFHCILLDLLSLLRVRALLLDRPWLVRLFTALWVISSGTAVGVGYFLLDGATIYGNSCMHTKLHVTLEQTCSAIHTFHGTCIAVATSRTLTTNVRVQQPRLTERFKVMIIGKGVPLFSKSLLRRSQYDFILMLSFNLLVSIGIAFNGIPLAYRIGTLVIAMTVLHCVACSTFRNIAKSKYETDVMIMDGLPPIEFSRNPEVSFSGTVDLGDVPLDESLGTQGRPRDAPENRSLMYTREDNTDTDTVPQSEAAV
ncbi:hypothetical protein PM082_012326 [Marasmius tenuissimus]|nr:hypothetical protein PM082_012326 [Marasmius tenuissimus]